MIVGNTINLRALESADSKAYHKWINDSETNYWRGVYHPMSEIQAGKWVEAESIPSLERVTFAIDAGADSFVGVIGLRGICQRSRRAEIWIYLGAKDQWGKGYGSDAIATTCRYAFEEMNLNRIWLECEPENLGAVRCYEKNGFVKEGTFKDGYFRHGEYRDTIGMALVKRDWKKA